MDLPGPFSDAMADYSKQLRMAPVAPPSRAKYLSRVRGFLAWLADSEALGDALNDGAARDWAVRDYRQDLKVVGKAAPTTINNTLAAIDDFYTRRGIGPAAARREDAPPRDAPRALSNQQARRFLRMVEQEPSMRNKVVALLPYYAGLRIGEVVGLDVDDVAISARKGQMRVLGKGRDGGKVRSVPIHAELRPRLQAWLTERHDWRGGAATPALLLNARGGRISDRYAREIIEGLGQLAGLDAERSEPFGPHVLRHTFGTQLVRGGVDLVTVAELMGDARLGTTRLYTLPTKADRDRALDALLTDG
jgi:integrase/recombinase XerC